jgi:hypothetical protein
MVALPTVTISSGVDIGPAMREVARSTGTLVLMTTLPSLCRVYRATSAATGSLHGKAPGPWPPWPDDPRPLIWYG